MYNILFILNIYYIYKRKEIYEVIFCNISHALFVFQMINYELQIVCSKLKIFRHKECLRK